ncbi:MAG: hypothetical protein IJ632_03355 [Muribaculaceae bacterium]|nr:hypothetical protein [Muribaculaceae bacterium]
MKTIGFIVVALLTLAIIAGLVSCSSSKNNKIMPPTGQLKSYSYSHSGTMAQPFRSYELQELAPDTVQLAVSGLSVELADTIIVPHEVLDEVARIIIKSKMYEYKDNYRPAFEVLDGEGWSFFATYDDDKYISSGGSNAWPPDASGLFTITNYLDSCLVKYRK